jgi:hypothetical protein
MENSPPEIQTMPAGALPGGVILLGIVGTKREALGMAAVAGGAVGPAGDAIAVVTEEDAERAAEAA